MLKQANNSKEWRWSKMRNSETAYTACHFPETNKSFSNKSEDYWTDWADWKDNTNVVEFYEIRCMDLLRWALGRAELLLVLLDVLLVEVDDVLVLLVELLDEVVDVVLVVLLVVTCNRLSGASSARDILWWPWSSSALPMEPIHTYSTWSLWWIHDESIPYLPTMTE